MLPLLVLVICIPLLWPSFAISYLTSNNQWHWCDQTPYPQSCSYHTTHFPNFSPPEGSKDIKKMSVQVAMNIAMLAKHQAMLHQTKCRNKRELAAWSDCIQLYRSTVHQLNRTLDAFACRSCSSSDLMTWLSAALTYTETCRTGFTELNISRFPPLLNNVTELISNSLTIAELKMAHEQYKNSTSDPGSKGFVFSEANMGNVKADLVVAKDGSGHSSSINEAVKEASKRATGVSKRIVIHVKQGVYNEYVEVGVPNLMLVGDGIGKTIITGSRSVAGGFTTFSSATFVVSGDRFIARGITFRNTAGPSKFQAVAVRTSADFSVFYRCSFEGYQDTLYVHNFRQFYRECDIYGTIDFIFGNAAVVFQFCNIYARRPMTGQMNVITAHSRTDIKQNTAITIQNCRVMAASDLKPVQGSFETYLGRPWFSQYSTSVYMKTYLDRLISPAGWLEWSGEYALRTLYFGEYMNTGPGALTISRVKWGGYHVITDSSTAFKFTTSHLINGDVWLPSTGVPFDEGL